ncbi:hypothetical protein [Clostridium tertium]|uniref:hypothetical protein n=1 Tax=Clostridium tertium TaxID=1559 RepID=UPI00291C4A65|nr:hypothetical protein [Clostridium sp.]
MKRYLAILKEENQFGFKDETDKILDEDIQITNEDYALFFEKKSTGKQFRLKEISTGNGLFDYIEEYIPDIKEVTKEPGIEEMLLDHEYRLSKVELGV